MISHVSKLFRVRQSLSTGALSPLAIKDFRWLLTSNALWWTTRFMEMIVVGWLVLELTDSAWQVAIIGFYRSAPFLISGFVAGPIIDRFGRRKIIIVAQALNVLVYGVLALLLWFNLLVLWHLALGSVLMGFGWSVDWPARQALLPDLVGRKKTVDALQLGSISQNVSRIAGPFTSGLLIDSFGAFGAFAAMAAFATLALLCLLRLSSLPIPKMALQADRPSPLANIIEGLQYVRQTRAILAIVLITIVLNFFVFPYFIVLPVFARDILSQGPVGLGLLGSVAGVGAFLGILLINYIRRYTSSGWIFAIGSGFQAIAILAFAFSGSYPLSLAMLFLSGIGQAWFGVMQSSIILLAASDEMRSRAMGSLVLAFGIGPLGQLQIGAASDAIGAPWGLRINAFLAVVIIVIIALALPELRSQGEEDGD